MEHVDNEATGSLHDSLDDCQLTLSLASALGAKLPAYPNSDIYRVRMHVQTWMPVTKPFHATKKGAWRAAAEYFVEDSSKYLTQQEEKKWNREETLALLDTDPQRAVEHFISYSATLQTYGMELHVTTIEE